MTVLESRNLAAPASRSLFGRGESPRPSSFRTYAPTVEQLDQLVLLSVGCPEISGFVYLDQNSNPVLTNNGHFDTGEVPLANAVVVLLDANNNQVASTTTDANGAYRFDRLPNTNVSPITTVAQTVAVGTTATPFSNQPFGPSAISLFDPSLGTLRSVSITYSATVNSNLLAENPAPIPIPITALLNGSYQINGLPQLITGSGSASSGPVVVPAEDPANPGANDFPVNLTVSGQPTTLTLTSASDLAFFTASAGRTTFTPTMSATADATISGAGVQFTKITTATGTITISYTYDPKVCIPNGQYTLVQIPNPPQLINGKPSQPSEVFAAPPVGQPQILHVTVNDVDLPDNNFAKLSAGVAAADCPTPGTLVRYGVHHQQTRLVLTFVGDVDPAMANNPANYRILTSNGRAVRIVSATFDPATNAVTLIPARSINVHYRYDLSVTLPCSGPCNNAVVPFGGRKSLGGFQNHRGQFVPVVNGELVRPNRAAGSSRLALARAHAVARRGRG